MTKSQFLDELEYFNKYFIEIWNDYINEQLSLNLDDYSYLYEELCDEFVNCWLCSYN